MKTRRKKQTKRVLASALAAVVAASAVPVSNSVVHAEARSVEVSTIKTQIKGLLRKFGCSRTKEIVQIIRELNIEHLF